MQAAQRSLLVCLFCLAYLPGCDYSDSGSCSGVPVVTSTPTSGTGGGGGGSGTFTCTSVTPGTACQISLSYTPAVADSGTLTLSFSYMNNSGLSKTGSISVPCAATVPPP